MKDHYQFGKNLRQVMDALGLDQTDLSERTGLTQAAISQLLNGIRDPSLHTIVRILQVIPVKFEKLVTMENKNGSKRI
jgi:transcriptional regulator with XRE-family HTH domain